MSGLVHLCLVALVVVSAASLGVGCGSEARKPSTPKQQPDGGPPREQPDAAGACKTNADCDNGRYCDGDERCDPGSDGADLRGCAAGTPIDCDDGIACTEDECSDTLSVCRHRAPDADQDGHFDIACKDARGEALGDDCDDTDANRYPGNLEVCDAAWHDEDCSVESFGKRDRDGDLAFDGQCCNVAADGTRHCGDDCDDTTLARRPGQLEICDAIDNDCDGAIDEEMNDVPWYTDTDGDGFGDDASSSTASCTPIPGRSLLASDCDGTRADAHPAAREACGNDVDDDCDGMSDEAPCVNGSGDLEEACTSEGESAACLCAHDTLGTRTCGEDGRYGTCRCTEVGCQGERPCQCPNGRESDRSCQADGAYGACECGPECLGEPIVTCRCDDGRIGQKQCDGGSFGRCDCSVCQANADCDDGAACNGVERCDPVHAEADARGCIPGPMPSNPCDDGKFCNGQERCAPGDDGADQRGCLVGTPEPTTCACSNGSVGTRTCQASGAFTACDCSQPPPQCNADADCDDGRRCNGTEACDPSAAEANALGCVPGTPIDTRCMCGAETGVRGCLEGGGFTACGCGSHVGDQCGDAIPITASGSYVFSTTGLANDYAQYGLASGSNCLAAQSIGLGADMVFVVQASSRASVEVGVEAAGFLAAPSIAETCPTGACFGVAGTCDCIGGNATNPFLSNQTGPHCVCGGGNGTLRYHNATGAAQPIYITVDGAGAFDDGMFLLTVDIAEAVCGDGKLSLGEECDDGVPDSDGDGCSANCILEPDFLCGDASPSMCLPLGRTLVINEFDTLQSGTDKAELIEIFNPSPYQICGVTLEFLDASGTAYQAAFDLPALDPGEYFVLVGAAIFDQVPAGARKQVLPDNRLLDGPGALRLVLKSTGAVLDAVHYGGSVPSAGEGTPAPMDTGDDSAVGRCLSGSDTDDNGADFQLLAPTPGTANCPGMGCGPCPLTCCGGECVDTDASLAHCGGCGQACGGGDSCCSTGRCYQVCGGANASVNSCNTSTGGGAGTAKPITNAGSAGDSIAIPLDSGPSQLP